MDMLTLFLLFAFQVSSPRKWPVSDRFRRRKYRMMSTLQAFRTREPLPAVRVRCFTSMVLVYPSKSGTAYRVMRPEGRVRAPKAKSRSGIYYKDIGTIQIESVQSKSATARVLFSCQGMMVKGDLVVPSTQRPVVEYAGNKSSDSLPSRGPFQLDSVCKGRCAADGCRRLLLYSTGPARRGETGRPFCCFPCTASTTRKIWLFWETPSIQATRRSATAYRYRQDSMLYGRTLPPKVLGDIVIVEAGDGLSTGKIINSLSEIHRGDTVVKK